MIKMVNLTPHDVNFVDNDGNIVRTVKPSGVVARLSVETIVIGEIDGIQVTESVFSDIENLPEEAEDTIYIVSSLVAEKAKRADVYVPNGSVRDSNGRIIGCKSLGRI